MRGQMDSESSDDDSDIGLEDTENIPLLSSAEWRQDHVIDQLPDDNGRSHQLAPRNKIPHIVWMVMKVACVFYHRNVIGSRKCFRCMIRENKERAQSSRYDLIKCMSQTYPVGRSYEDPDEEFSSYDRFCNFRDKFEGTDDSTPCQSCESLWWNYDGVVEKYDNETIGVTWWNHSGSWLLSVVIVFGALCIALFDVLGYLKLHWGKETQILHVISYGALIMNLMLYPALNLCSKITSRAEGNTPHITWTTAMNARYILKRLQFVGFHKNGIPGKLLLLLCHTVPPLLATYRGFVYAKFSDEGLTTRSSTSVIFVGITMWIWANFQYIIYLTRCSFQRQFILIQHFLETHKARLDDCRLILGNAIQDFNSFCKFIDMYMAVFIPINTWAITSQVTWQYLVQANLCEGKSNPEITAITLPVIILSWSTVSYITILCLWSVGGFDVSSILDQFRVNIMTSQRSSEKFWEKIVKSVDDLSSSSHGGGSMTMIFSVISFFMALKIGQDQSVSTFTSLPKCNFSEIASTVFPVTIT